MSNTKPTFLVQAAAVAIVSAAVHIGSLSVGFYYDDIKQVLSNPLIKDVRYIPEIFTTSVWGFAAAKSNYYRPLMHMAYMLFYHLFGMNPWGFHLANVALHCAVSVLVFMTARRLLKGRTAAWPTGYVSPAFVAAVLFAVDPVHSDAVTWVACLPELLCAFFFMLSFYLYIRTTGQTPLSYTVLCLSAASFFLSLLSKETAVVLPVVIVAYDLAYMPGTLKARDCARRYAPFVFVASLYAIMRVNALGNSITPYTLPGLSAYQYIINLPVLFASYLMKLILPIRVTLFHDFWGMDSLLAPKAIISFLAVAAFFALVFAIRRRDKAAFIGLVIAAATIVPCLYIKAIGAGEFAGGLLHLPFSERYLYIPSIGFVLVLALLFEMSAKRGRVSAVAAVLAFLAVFAVYSAGTVKRISYWQDDLTFWSHEVEASPGLDVPRVNLGMTYGRRGQLGRAKEELNGAFRVNPGNPDIYNDLGIIYSQEGQTDKAIEEFREAVRLEPSYADAQFNLGLELEKKGLFDEAVSSLEAAVRLVPEDDEFRDALSEAYELKKNASGAAVR